MLYKVSDVAKWLLSEGKRQGIVMTHMKLQKLLYYSQAYMLGMTGQPLFDDEIQSWEHGPVVPRAYHIYDRYGANPITDVEDVSIPDDVASLINAVINDKGRFPAYKLRKMTHEERSWREAMAGNKVISQEIMKEEFIPKFWGSDEEDEYQPAFATKEDEEKYFLDGITNEEREIILQSR